MVSTRPLISKFFRPCTNPLVTVPTALVKISVTITFMFHSFYSSIARSRYLSLFRFLSVLFCGQQERKNPLLRWFSFFLLFFFFFFFFFTLTRSSPLAEIKWSICISKLQKIRAPHFLDWFWVVHIPFVHMIKFKLLAQFPIDDLSHPVVSSLILFLRKLTAFTYCVIYRSVSITTYPHMLFCWSCLFSFWHSPYGVVLCC